MYCIKPKQNQNFKYEAKKKTKFTLQNYITSSVCFLSYIKQKYARNSNDDGNELCCKLFIFLILMKKMTKMSRKKLFQVKHKIHLNIYCK